MTTTPDNVTPEGNAAGVHTVFHKYWLGPGIDCPLCKRMGKDMTKEENWDHGLSEHPFPEMDDAEA